MKRAISLLQRWNHVRNRHMNIPGGCSCGYPVAHISASDFEHDMIDYLAARPEFRQQPELAELIGHCGNHLNLLLKELSSREGSLGIDEVLDLIERGINSFERLQKG